MFLAQAKIRQTFCKHCQAVVLIQRTELRRRKPSVSKYGLTGKHPHGGNIISGGIEWEGRGSPSQSQSSVLVNASPGEVTFPLLLAASSG